MAPRNDAEKPWISRHFFYSIFMLVIQENISLKNYNTFHIDAKAKFFVEVKSEDEFAELQNTEIWKEHPHFFLWWGANILFTKDFDGIIIKNAIMGKHILREENDTIFIKAWSGESWAKFVNRCVEQWYQWLENLALIPWTIGWSAVGNIGAYGTEAKDVIYEVEYLEVPSIEYLVPSTKHNETNVAPRKILRNAECKFAYRESIFKHELKNKVFITAVIFALKKVKDATPLKQAVADIVAIRKTKLPDPAQTGTAGSFFKNPTVTEKKYLELKEKYPELISFPAGELVKLAAGQLIELTGLKWYTQWNVGVSVRHALILINLGNGTGEEMMQLANHIISEVKKNFWVTLEPEVIIM